MKATRLLNLLNLMQMRICWHPGTSVLQIRICVQATSNKKMREFYTPSLVSTPCYSLQNFQYPKFSFYTLDNIPRFPHEKEEKRGRSLILSPESHKNSCRCWPLSDVRSTDNGSHSPERAQSRENFTKKKLKTIRTSAWSATHAKIPLFFQTTHQAQPRHPKAWWEESAIAVSCYL